MTSLRIVRDYIEKLGGLQAVAALAQVEPTTVSAWQARLGQFPANTYLLFRKELERRGHPEEPPASLWGMKVHPTSRKRSHVKN